MAREKKRKVRIRAREKDGIVEVKARIAHPMETGLRRDLATGGYWPEHIITEGIVRLNGEIALKMEWSIAISKNPYIEFRFHGKTGDQIDFWLVDNHNNVLEGSEIVQ